MIITDDQAGMRLRLPERRRFARLGGVVELYARTTAMSSFAGVYPRSVEISIRGWGGPSAALTFPGMRTPADILPTAAQRFGNATALVTSARTLSFVELDVLSDAVAAGLIRGGLAAGNRVSLYSENRWEWIVAYHGILKAGLVVNPLNVMLTPSEVGFVVKDSGVTAVIGSAERVAPIVAMADDLPSLRALFAFDSPSRGITEFETLLDPTRSSFDRVAADPASVGSIGYTSGTTGYPKGAMQPHRAVLLNASLTATMHGRRQGDVMATALPAAHVYGNAAIHATFMTGGTVVLQERFDAGAMLELVERHAVNLIEGVPAMYAALLSHEDLPARDLRTIRYCTVGGQTMSVETMRDWEARSGGRLIELWGMTEIAGLGTTHAVHAPAILGSIGVSLPGVGVRVSGLEDPVSPAAPGEPGELQVKGPIVMLGYWGNEQATAEAFTTDGWLRTGDVATENESGHFFVVDRQKDLIVTAGFNVYPAEIERVINSHPAVSIAAVGKQPDAVKGELAAAYVVLRPGASVSRDELLRLCRTELAAYKVPRSIDFVDALPMTSTGKIMRRELSKHDGAPTLA